MLFQQGNNGFYKHIGTHQGTVQVYTQRLGAFRIYFDDNGFMTRFDGDFEQTPENDQFGEITATQ